MTGRYRDNKCELRLRCAGLDEPKSPDNRELKLINLVRGCPLLYDKNHIDNKDVHKREFAWLKISKAMSSAGTFLISLKLF